MFSDPSKNFNAVKNKNRIVFSILASILIVVLILIFGAWYGVSHYNQIQYNDEAVSANWSNVVNQYKRRADLIPNVIIAVEKYAAHESELLKDITEARQRASGFGVSAKDQNSIGEFLKAQHELSRQMARIFAVVEKYPDLKANQLFQDLIIQLEGSENRISYARQRYISAVANYNLSVRQFPGSLIANMSGLKRISSPEFGFDANLANAPKTSKGK